MEKRAATTPVIDQSRREFVDFAVDTPGTTGE